MKDLITAAEVCKAFDISTKTLYRWRKNMGFPASVTGKLLRFRVVDVTAWIEWQKECNEAKGTNVS